MAIAWIVSLSLLPTGLLLVGLFILPRRHFWAKLCRSIARCRRLAIALTGGLMFLNAILASAASPVAPRQQDEFCYLLAADTFRQGRLTNPTPPAWEHFETTHVLMHPTYSSKYPPAQGVILALGWVIGHPIIGVWLGVTIAAMATTWMLQAILPARWALTGGLLLSVLPALHFGGDFAWSRTYWGGGVALTGGALASGGVFRLRRPSIGAGLALGTGLGLLAISRPFEGLVTALPLGFVTLVWAYRHRHDWSAIYRVGLPMALVSGLFLTAMTCHNSAVTGSPWELPYMAHSRQYAVVPLFLWQPLPQTPGYVSPTMQDAYRRWEIPFYEGQQTLTGWLDGCWRKLERLERYFAQPLLLALIAVPLLWRSSRVRLAAGIVGLLLLAMMQTTWALPHYAAPAVALFVYLGVQGLRVWAVARPIGLVVSRLVLAVIALIWLMEFVTLAESRGQTEPGEPWHLVRHHIHESLLSRPGQQLVIVVETFERESVEEWVFNGAEIPRAKVLWARSLGPGADRCLIETYPGRMVWRLDLASRSLRPWSEQP